MNKLQSLLKFRFRSCSLMSWSLILIMATGLLASCATSTRKEDTGPIFYPPLPNSPRLQYLATFSSETDVRGKKSGFQDFLLGSRDEQSHLVKKPYGVAMYDGAIYVIDTRGNGYGVFDLRNKKAFTVIGSGAGRMKKPINITIDKDGSRYITDTQINQVLVFDTENQFVKAYGKEGWFQPSDVAITEDKLFIADLKNHNIQVLSKQTGEQLYSISRPGPQDGELFYPTNLKIGTDGYLYVSDSGNFRIQRFTLDGEFADNYGAAGTSPGRFARPKGIAIDRVGRRYVIDAAFENVQIISPDGELLLFFGAPGYDRDSINLPTDIEIDYNNVNLFQKYAAPDFKIEYIILVASQFGMNKVNVYGFGQMEGMEY